ncbi:MAG: ATP phosphoribosyltransferase [Proteobacteria bacterium]|nr:ATP phosphoribosyltransferase [Pseudomonadota bacterium]
MDTTMERTGKTKIAVQKSGRLAEPSLNFLYSQGLEFEPNGRNLVTPCENYDIDILHLRDDDIPEYVCRSVVDYGIVGENVLYEKNVQVNVVKRLGFCHCALVLAVPEGSQVKVVEDLEGERIATSHPRLLAKFLEKSGVNAAIITIKGSVEVTPTLNLADAVCDITQTGRTLREQNLSPLITVLESQAVLIESPFSNPNRYRFPSL